MNFYDMTDEEFEACLELLESNIDMSNDPFIETQEDLTNQLMD